MRHVDSKLDIINQKFQEISQRIEQKVNFDNRFGQIFSQKIQPQNVNQNPSSSIDQLFKHTNPNNQYNILNSVNRDTIIEFRGFKMKAEVAVRFLELEKMIKQHFPGRQIIITSAMDGKHVPNSAHYRGEALDFVVEPLTIEESKIVEKLAEKAGFKVYNEYIYDSPYKTGPHMHIQL
ncbi:MAG: hypothetical protein RMJ51_02715 [Candidatus Calescibacterium sp.]|nr:hypothetical protein [Candidatus Calescibacterium sp.]MCX7972259.1 hypothetical protein [bacterium]MDW8195139.1 hypothetical protein [Candidatus Calescibacterium sp.]